MHNVQTHYEAVVAGQDAGRCRDAAFSKAAGPGVRRAVLNSGRYFITRYIRKNEKVTKRPCIYSYAYR